MTREFKRYYGVTPYQYILDRKIAVARRLLLVTNMKVFEISAQLGFSDEYYFSDLFKAKTGVSPLDTGNNVKKRAAEKSISAARFFMRFNFFCSSV